MKKHAQLFTITLFLMFSFPTYSYSNANDGTLVKQCFALSKQLSKIAAIQVKSKCRNNTANAALGLSMAGADILIHNYKMARKRLNEVVTHLQAVEGVSCVRKKVLWRSKAEIISIRDQV